MARGFVYLVAVLDWFSRRVLSWRVSNSMTADFCVEALEEAISRYGAPEIFNTDQGSQFTAASFIDVLQRNKIRISMDGRGAWRDNVFVERLWKLCAQGRYVADSARRSRFAVDARRMRAHNDGTLGGHGKRPGGRKDDCERVRAARTRFRRRVRRPHKLKRTQPVQQ